MKLLFDSSLHTQVNSPGIYYIKVNETNYVGSSINVRTRLFQHRNELTKNIHPNSRMQNTFNKYGEAKVWYSLIEQFDSISIPELLERERYWIELLGPVLNVVLDPTPHNNSASLGKTVYQFNLNGSQVGSYPSTKEAGRQTGIAASSIIQVCNGKLNHAGKFFWSYTPVLREVKALERSKWKWKPVVMTVLETKREEEFKSCADAARAVAKLENIENFESLCSRVSAIAQGKQKQLMNKYIFRYKV